MLLLAALALIQDPVVTGYVERLCHKLQPDVIVNVTVDKGQRAETVPGAIAVTTGMIAGAQNEAELAGILGHEIGHFQLHTICQRFTTPASLVANARQAEHDADQAAIPILRRAGYDPTAMLHYFSSIRHAEVNLSVEAFSAEDILIERLQLEATDHPMKDPTVDTPEFRLVHERVK